MDSDAHHRGPPAHVRQNNECILLGPRGGMLHEELRSRLDDHGWRPIIVEDPHLAMAELCLRDHARRSRGAMTGSRSEPPALVLAGPAVGGGVNGLREMFQAIRRWLPEASIWLYANEELLPLFGAKLTRGEEGDQVDHAPKTTVHREWDAMPRVTGPATPRTLRLTEPIAAAADAADENEPPDDDMEEAEDEAGRITAEEIEMLLQREPTTDERADP
jgi:hypothetical protein